MNSGQELLPPMNHHLPGTSVISRILYPGNVRLNAGLPSPPRKAAFDAPFKPITRLFPAMWMSLVSFVEKELT